MVSFKREQNLKELLLRGDPYNIKRDITENSKLGYKRCVKRCDSCDNFVLVKDHIISNATGRCFTIKGEFSCSSKCVVYCAFCMKCGQQGVGSTMNWKPRLANYKAHIKKKIPSCTGWPLNFQPQIPGFSRVFKLFFLNFPGFY